MEERGSAPPPMGLVSVRAPASTANLGPGFDCLGAALQIYLEVRVTPGERSEEDADLVRRAVVAAGGPSDARIEVRSDIPPARGLGSSAACVAAGLVAGCVLGGTEPEPASLVPLGSAIEGHPDNVAAALYGGLTLALPGGDVLRFAPAASVRPVILVPDQELRTAEARSVLPDEIALSDAVANIARASGLLALLTGAAEPTADRLLACTQDLLHQPARAPLMPQTAAAVSFLRGAGIAAAVSGAGPAVVCLVVAGGEDAVRDASRSLEGWEVLEPGWDVEGARVMRE